VIFVIIVSFAERFRRRRASDNHYVSRQPVRRLPLPADDGHMMRELVEKSGALGSTGIGIHETVEVLQPKPSRQCNNWASVGSSLPNSAKAGGREKRDRRSGGQCDCKLVHNPSRNNARTCRLEHDPLSFITRTSLSPERLG